MSQWTSKYAIMRDLAEAQGWDVPVNIEGTITEDDKPPPLDITEDTEKEYYDQVVGDENFELGPDLGLIQQMLDMVRDSNHCLEENDEDNSHENSKIHPARSKVAPNNEQQTNFKKSKEKPIRNVALKSLYKIIGKDVTGKKEINQSEDSTIQLEKPDDLVSKNLSESVQKVNSLSKDLKELGIYKQVPEARQPRLMLEPMNMFKKKIRPEKPKELSIDVPKIDEVTPPVKVYQPSENVDTYLNAYTEKLPSRDTSVWAEAERQMREIDKIRKLRAAMSLKPIGWPEDVENVDLLDLVRLPQHRHLSAGECIVCEVAEKNGFNTELFKDESHTTN